MAEDELICFTNCFLPLEDGTLVERDLWIDAKAGVILNAQVRMNVNFPRAGLLISLSANILLCSKTTDENNQSRRQYPEVRTSRFAPAPSRIDSTVI
jgi:hypothetical protein